MEKQVIESWYKQNKRSKTYSIERINLNLLIKEYKFNLKVFNSIVSRMDIPVIQQKEIIEIDLVDVNDCLLFLKVDENGYEVFNNLIKEFGFTYFEERYENIIIEHESVYVFFKKLNKDRENRPTFNGLARYYYANDDYNEFYIGQIVNNLRTGFGVYKYAIWYQIWKADDGYLSRSAPAGFCPYENLQYDISLFYCGQWLNNMKNGFGILASYNENFNYKDYYLLGNWQNDKLIEIYKSNSDMLKSLKPYIDYKIKGEILDENYKADENPTISIDDISCLFEHNSEPFKFPILV